MECGIPVVLRLQLLLIYHPSPFTLGRPQVSRRTPQARRRTRPAPFPGSAQGTWRHLSARLRRGFRGTEGPGSPVDTGAVWHACRCWSNSTRLGRVLPARTAGARQPQQPLPVNNANTARSPPNGSRPSAETRSAYAENGRMARTELEHPPSNHRTSVSCFLMPDEQQRLKCLRFTPVSNILATPHTPGGIEVSE